MVEMTQPRIAVVIPVGPEGHHADYLADCLDSVADLEPWPFEVVIVDDMHALTDDYVAMRVRVPFEVYRPPWRLGVGSAFNHGVARAHARGADLALMLGADDRLERRALAELEATYVREKRRDGYYWFEVEYSTGVLQRLPCNNAAVTAGFMRQTGGLPIEAACGGMDAALVSAMLVHWPDALIHVDGRDEARFWSRVHPQQASAELNRFGQAIGIVRDVITETFTAPSWGRYE